MNGISGLYSNLQSVKRKNSYTRGHKDMSNIHRNSETIFVEPARTMKKTVVRKRARAASVKDRSTNRKRAKPASSNRGKNVGKPPKKNINAGKRVKKTKKIRKTVNKRSRPAQNRHKDRF